MIVTFVNLLQTLAYWKFQHTSSKISDFLHQHTPRYQIVASWKASRDERGSVHLQGSQDKGSKCWQQKLPRDEMSCCLLPHSVDQEEEELDYVIERHFVKERH